MSVTGRATVKWAVYRQDGTFTGQQGTIGVSDSGTKATAFCRHGRQFLHHYNRKVASTGYHCLLDSRVDLPKEWADDPVPTYKERVSR